MKRLALMSACLLLAACGGSAADPEDFRSASPSRQELQIRAPAGGGKALTDEIGAQQQALGQTAEFYKLTVAVTTVVNGGLAFVVALCEAIVKHEPTQVSETQAVWGPHTEPLSPDSFRFTVTRTGDGFEYVLHTRPKEATEEGAWVAILSGTHTPGAKARQGKGSFTIDWDAAQAMGRKPRELGKATYQYERDARDDVAITAQFAKVRDEETGDRVDADYGFTQANGGDGSFDFVVHKDLHNKNGAKEKLSVRSRWTNAGAGRADLRVSGGDLTAPVEGSECWSTGFLRTYYKDSIGLAPAEGDETACVYAAPQYSSL